MIAIPVHIPFPLRFSDTLSITLLFKAAYN